MAPRTAELVCEGLHQGRAAEVLIASLGDGFSKMCLGLLGGSLGKAGSNSFASELDQRLGSVQAADAHQLFE